MVFLVRREIWDCQDLDFLVLLGNLVSLGYQYLVLQGFLDIKGPRDKVAHMGNLVQTCSLVQIQIGISFEHFSHTFIGLKGDPGPDGPSGYGPEGLPGIRGPPGQIGNTHCIIALFNLCCAFHLNMSCFAKPL